MLSAVTSTCIPTLRSSLLFISFSPSLRVYKLLRRSAYVALKVAAPSADKRSDTFCLLSAMISAITESWNWPIKMEPLNAECCRTDRNLTEIRFSVTEKEEPFYRGRTFQGNCWCIVPAVHRVGNSPVDHQTVQQIIAAARNSWKGAKNLHNSLLTPKHRAEQFPNGCYTSGNVLYANKVSTENVWTRKKTTLW